MLVKMTRALLIDAHLQLVETIIDNDIAPYAERTATPKETAVRAAGLSNILSATINYAALVVEDTYAHLGAAEVYAAGHLQDLRQAALALNRLLAEHAAAAAAAAAATGERACP